MKLAIAFILLNGLWSASGAEVPTAASLAQQLASLTLDSSEAYRVRDLQLRRGDVSLYFNEGALLFAKPVAGKRIAAVFVTTGIEAGDAEILVLPRQASERTSLAAFTGSPNLDEHFTVALLFFADNTFDEVKRNSLQSASDLVPQFASRVEPVLQHQAVQIQTTIIGSLLDHHAPAEGFFSATVVGKQLGQFQFVYQPDTFEPVTIGSGFTTSAGHSEFALWTGFRPHDMPSYVLPPSPIHNYKLDVVLNPDLSMKVSAEFEYQASAADGRVIPLNLSPALEIEDATIDGTEAEIVSSASSALSDAPFLVVNAKPLVAGQKYLVRMSYAGSIIKRVSANSYFVGDRNIWYPHSDSMSASFDLVFHYPDRYRLVATGEPVGEETTVNHVRTQERRTPGATQLVGFNLGQYLSTASSEGPYRVACYAEPSASAGMNGIPEQSDKILAYYTSQWVELPIHSLAVTPIPGYFGQGFPGLVYLSTMAYLREEERPAEVRSETANLFFDELLLPHEIAHQWWGNLVTSADYRSAWLMEAMANYAALQFLEQREGSGIMNEFLLSFRNDLLKARKGKPVEASGPVDFGIRLLNNNDEEVWHTVIYEKGSWALHMLHEKLGDQRFRQLQKNILTQWAGKPINNDQFRQAASSLLSPEEPDHSLSKFFETWIYSTGIPQIRLAHSSVSVSEVEDDFTADLPLHCGGKIRWLPITAGDNPLPHRAEYANCQLPAQTEFLYRP